MFMDAKIVRVRPAGDDHQVVTVEGGPGGYRRRPCAQCPWRVDAIGVFPPEAFRHSASTAYDMAQNTFACHESGTKRTAMCAGFLLRGAEHNLKVRMGYCTGRLKDDVDDGGHELHSNFRAMAMAIPNGVPADDDVLAPCRD